MGSKRMKLEEEKEDRISDLPDEIIQLIISFLPSTKEAIKTSILSKRWRKQWTHVPVLIFDYTGMSSVKFLQFISDTLHLHECSKMKKFYLQYRHLHRKDAEFDEKIRFAIRKDVEELYLISDDINYKLPKFLYNNNNASLVKLKTEFCTFMMPIDQKVNWGCLTGLNMKNCSLTDRAMELIVSGSPLLKLLELSSCDKFDKLVIASKSLECLVLENLNRGMSIIQISCPELKELKLLGCLTVTTVDLLNLPSLIRPTIDFFNDRYRSSEIKESLIKDILHQLQHIDQELIIGSWFMMILSSLGVEGRFTQVLNIKSLTLNDPDLHEHSYFGIISLLRNSPKLEKLIFNFSPLFQERCGRAKSYWNSNLNVFDGLVKHLKTIKIIGFPKSKGICACLLNFIQFLLKNARALEKMVIELKGYGTSTFRSKLLQELLSSTRCSQHAVIEVLCSNK